MCVICVKRRGVRMPTEAEARAMWDRNPDGAGYMYARDGQVVIKKGFLDYEGFKASLASEGLTCDDALIVHFRISTQAGVTPTMCHPFPISGDLGDMERLEATAEVGLAHNGIIQRTSDGDKRYSDTALFVTRYVSALVREEKDIHSFAIAQAIQALAPGNRFALMNGRGEIALIGEFERRDGLFYSNLNHLTRDYPRAAWWKEYHAYGKGGKNYRTERKK